MFTRTALLLMAAFAASSVRAETFLIPAVQPGGREAVIKVPVGAITQLSADFAESLANDADAQFESMRLKGGVLIAVAGSIQPIEIKADSVVLELTADGGLDAVKAVRVSSAAHEVLRSTATVRVSEDAEMFVGNVVFDVQTPSGPMEITADRVEHRVHPVAPAAPRVPAVPKPGA
jgi:hypothetical protein